MSIFHYFLIAAILGIVGVMVSGVVLMGMGGAMNDKYSNKLMRARVLLQGLVLVLIAIIFLTK